MISIKAKILNKVLSMYGEPMYATSGSAGMDIRACISNDIELKPNETVMIPSGLAIHIGDPSLVAFVLPRSGLGTKKGIVLGNLTGVIDSDYTGEIGICVWNRGTEVQKICPGDKVCQIVFLRTEQVCFEYIDQFEQTERNDGGFGSTS